ncbi:MAG TPA: serine hydrolase domain-containing protein [Phycisphaerales bacterium]|nr:serine hydrolase domain-containing protein [Phycisphaerales bacterium]
MGAATTNAGNWKRSVANWIARRHPALARARLTHAISRNAPGLMAQANVPGLQVSFVFGDGEPVTLCFGVASNATREVMTDRHRIRLGSISKPVATMVFLQQIDAGVMGLDEPLGAELAALCPHLPREFVDRVTPRLALSHATGLAGQHPPRTRVQMRSCDWLCDASLVRVARQPGEASEYCGAGYAMLEAVLEQRRGKCFAEIAREGMLRPLGREWMGFECGDADDLGRGEMICPDHAVDGSVLTTFPVATVSSSGLLGTTGDVCRVLRDGMFTSAMLSERMRRERLVPQPVGMSGAEFTLGLHLYKGSDPRSLGHGGHREGHRSMVVVVPVKRAVLCAAANSENGDVVIRRLTGLFRGITIG